MVVVLRLLYLGAALLAIAAGTLVIASFCIPERAPQSTESIGIHIVVAAVFLGAGVVLLGIQRHVAGIAALTNNHDGETAEKLASHVSRLLAHLVAGGVFLCVVLGVMAYAILARIDQRFAVFS
jgi:predicted PurR-regulated permease PerM